MPARRHASLAHRRHAAKELRVIRACELPDGSLLQSYRESGAYADCYCVELPRAISQAQYIQAFYTTWLFKIERRLLAWFVAKPSTDLQASALAAGSSDAFAAWRVEGRRPDQLLMCDYQGRTRSWLMSEPAPGNATADTRLYFGSAVVPLRDPRSGRSRMGFGFRALLGFHKIYSRLLLQAAARRLLQLPDAKS
jgi:hypothetical protein